MQESAAAYMCVPKRVGVRFGGEKFTSEGSATLGVNKTTAIGPALLN